VKTHGNRILAKLTIHSRAQAVVSAVAAYETGLVRRRWMTSGGKAR
jgi:hypothetical protein